MRPQPVEIKKVLLSAYTGLGNFILKTPLIEKFEKLYPGCRLYLIAGNAYGTEFVLHNYPTLILSQDCSAFKKMVFFLKMRKEKFDAIFLPMDASPKFLIRGSIIAGIPIRIGHVLNNRHIPGYYLTTKIPVEHTKARSEIDINFDLLQSFSGREFIRDYRPRIDIKCDSSILDKFGLEKYRYVCLQMSAANGQQAPKVWLEDRFCALLQKLLAEYPDLNMVALGDRGDSVVVSRICSGVVSARLKNLSGKTTLEEAKNIIYFGKLLICHDSGLLHVGNALRKELIALYGCSDPDFYALNVPTCHIIRKECDCSPCLGLFPGIFAITEAEAALRCPAPKCMQSITVDEVYVKCTELLQDRKPA